MVHREIDVDEETDRILAEIARDYDGDLGKAVAELAHAHESLEVFIDKNEEIHRESLLAQVDRSEEDFRSGRFVPWEEVKRRNGL